MTSTNPSKLPLVLYRFDQTSDQSQFVQTFEDSFELLICDSNAQALKAIEELGDKIDALVLDQNQIDAALPRRCREKKPDLLTIQLHSDIALDDIVALLESGLVDKCFAKPYDSKRLRSEIFTCALRLPLDPSPDQADVATNEKHYVALIVDDETTATKFLRKQLLRLGCASQVLTAANAEEASELCAEHKEDLAIIISDQRMPGIKGNQLLNEVQKHNPHTIRMLTSAYEEVDIALNAVNEGRISRYIKKPWNAEEINALISLAVVEYRSRMQRAQSEKSRLLEQHEAIVARRQANLMQALGRSIGQYSGSDVLAQYFACLQSIETLPPSSASLRASRDTSLESDLVREFSGLIERRLNGPMLELLETDARQQKKLSADFTEVLADRMSSTGELTELNIELTEKLSAPNAAQNKDVSPGKVLAAQMLDCLNQLLESSGLDLNALELVSDTEEIVLKTRDSKEVSVYKHLLSPQTNTSRQMLEQQCNLFMLIALCHVAGANIVLKGKLRALEVSISVTHRQVVSCA